MSGRIRFAVAVLLLLAASCGPPINVRRVPPRTVTADLARSALNSDKESLSSENVLYRWNLTQQYKKDPEGALRVLHDKVVGGAGGSRATLFALAELSFEQGDRTRQARLVSRLGPLRVRVPLPRRRRASGRASR